MIPPDLPELTLHLQLRLLVYYILKNNHSKTKGPRSAMLLSLQSAKWYVPLASGWDPLHVCYCLMRLLLSLSCCPVTNTIIICALQCCSTQ